MIRPVTCVCFLLACGSGLYLYQSKHRVQVLDREIEKTVHANCQQFPMRRDAKAERLTNGNAEPDELPVPVDHDATNPANVRLHRP